MTASSRHQAMEAYFDSTEGNGGKSVWYGGTGIGGGYGAIAGGGSEGNGTGGGKGTGSGIAAPYNPKDYTYHNVSRGKDRYQEAHWNGRNGNGERCDGWVST